MASNNTEVATESAKASLTLFTGNLLSTIILAVSTIIIARLLGPDLYGVYTLTLLIPSIFESFIGFGISLAVTRYCAYFISRNEINMAKRITTNATIFLVLTGLIFTTITFLIGTYLSSLILNRQGLEPLVQLASIMILAYTILNSSQAIFIGWKMMNFVSISNVIHSILRLVIGPVLVLVGLGVLGALIGFIFSSMVTGVITLLMLFARKTHIRTTISNFFQDTKTMISYGFPTYVGGIVLGFATQYVTIILAAIASNSVVGYYQAASNFMVTISIISSAIYIALFPAFASLDGKQGDTVLAFKYAVKYASYIISPTIFLLIGAAEPLINIIYGHSYLSAVIYLQLLAFSYLPLVFGLTVIPSFLNGIGKTRLTMYQNFIGAISLVTLAPILSGFTDLRVQGLIYSILASNLIVVFSGLAILSRVLKASIEIKSIISILIASILSYLAIVALQQLNLPVLIMPFVDFFVFLLVYLTLLPIFRGIDNSDLDRLATVIEELGYVAKIAKFLFKYEKFVIMVWKKRIEH